jgi:hypothetical protein
MDRKRKGKASVRERAVSVLTPFGTRFLPYWSSCMVTMLRSTISMVYVLIDESRSPTQ